MGDGLLGGRHHTVISGDDNNRDISNLCTTGTHGSEGLMTWGIEEGDTATIFQLHIVCSDVLSDTTSLTCNHIRLANVVEQRCLTMVYMAHHSDNRCTGYQILLFISLFGHSLGNSGTHVLGLKAELISHKIDGLCIQTLVDGHHDADTHQRTDNICDRDVHHRSKFTHGNKLRQFQNLTLLALCACLLVHLLLNGITLLLTVFSTLLVLVLLVGKTCQRLFYLTCHILLVHLKRLLVAVTILLFLIAVLIILVVIVIIIIIIVIIIIIPTRIIVVLICGSVDIYTLLIDTYTSFAFAIGSCCWSTVLLLSLFLTFFTLLLLRFLLGTSALIERAEIYLAEHINLWSKHLLLALQLEYFCFELCCNQLFWLFLLRL